MLRIKHHFTKARIAFERFTQRKKKQKLTTKATTEVLLSADETLSGRRGAA